MDLDAWSLPESDPERGRRLAVGYGVGIFLCAVLGVGAASLHGELTVTEEEEQVVDVKLATKVEEAPKPPPPAPKVMDTPAPKPAGAPPPRALAVPTAIPTEAPPEAAPKADSASGDDPYATNPGSADGVPGGTGAPGASPVAPPPAPAAPPPPKPKAAGPIQLPENATPPVALANGMPAYPEQARREGVEAVVVVKYVVSETGTVQNITVVRGHPLFDAAVLAAMRSWRFTPAMVDGRPVAVFRTFKFPFKLKT